MDRIIKGTFSEPRYVTLTSCWSIAVLYCLWLIAPESLTMCQVEAWSTVGVVCTLTYLFVSSILVHRTVVNTYIFFIACMSLFVGGRYIAHAMGYDPMDQNWGAGMFAINIPSFAIMDLNPKEALHLSFYIVICLLSIHAGYMFSVWKKPREYMNLFDFGWTSTLKIPAIVLAVVSTIAFLLSFPEAYRSANSDGYVALYKTASDFTTRGSTAAQYGLLLALGLAFASRTKWLEFFVLGLLAIYYVANLKLGVRGGIMGFSLLCIWLFHTRIRRIDRIALIGIPIVLGALLIVAASGVRNFHFGEDTSSFLPWFLDNQGHTALYIHAATQINTYPALAYFHSIIPATPIAGALFGISVPLDQLYFGQFLSKTYMAGDAYQNGFGMGWSILADFYAYTLWIPGLYLIAAAGFGVALSRLANSTNPLVFGAHVMLFVKIMLLPRTGLYSIMPFVIVYIGILVACYLLSRLMKRRLWD